MMIENPDGTITKRLTLVRPELRGPNYKKTIEDALTQGYVLVREREEGAFLLLTFRPL
jgi:hypothetical protein